MRKINIKRTYIAQREKFVSRERNEGRKAKKVKKLRWNFVEYKIIEYDKCEKYAMIKFEGKIKT